MARRRKCAASATQRSVVILATAVLAYAAGPGCTSQPEKPKPPLTWDGLELVERPGLSLVQVRPCTNLSQYKRVMLRHAEVSFDPNWKPFQDPALKARKVDPNRIARDIETLFRTVTERELQKGSYRLVSSPDDDVLRVVPQINDLAVSYRDPVAPGDDAFVMDTGQITLVVELRDSLTNVILARVADRVEESVDGSMQVGGGTTGSAAAERAMTKWAIALRSALDLVPMPPSPECEQLKSKD